MLAVAKSEARFSTLPTIIHGATDRQNVACAEAVLCNRNFTAAVNEAGFPGVALTMLVFANGYYAAESSVQVLQPDVLGTTREIYHQQVRMHVLSQICFQ